MKATLEFNLPEEQEEHRIALNGGLYRSCIEEVREIMRRYRKHADFRDVFAEDVFKALDYDIKEALSDIP